MLLRTIIAHYGDKFPSIRLNSKRNHTWFNFLVTRVWNHLKPIEPLSRQNWTILLKLPFFFLSFFFVLFCVIADPILSASYTWKFSHFEVAILIELRRRWWKFLPSFSRIPLKTHHRWGKAAEGPRRVYSTFPPPSSRLISLSFCFFLFLWLPTFRVTQPAQNSNRPLCILYDGYRRTFNSHSANTQNF